MTIGKRIKYLRAQRGISQSQLSQASGVPLISIKRYETDKVHPQPEQIERLAEALGIGRFALTGENLTSLHVETVGDFIGLIISLCNSKVLTIIGERGTDGFLSEESFRIVFNPALDKYLKLCSTDGTGNIVNASAIIHTNSPLILPMLLKWEKAKYLYQYALSNVNEPLNSSDMKLLNDFDELIFKIELEAQKSRVLLNLDGQ